MNREDPIRGFPRHSQLHAARALASSSFCTVGRGMPSSKVSTSSRGEMDATGTDESTWAKDRRVDVRSGT
jgi:hypothetical protein